MSTDPARTALSPTAAPTTSAVPMKAGRARNHGALIVGATSGMARPLALELMRAGHDLVLTVRDAEEGARIAVDLRERGGRSVLVLPLDITDLAAHRPCLETARAALGGRLDLVVCCVGALFDNAEARADAGRFATTMMANATGPAHLLERAAEVVEPGGCLVGLSSVAGDRGRQSNYVYGAAKAAFTAFLSGLRNRLHPQGIAVVTIKPGFVATAMTHGLLNPKSPLVASPERAARGIARAIRRRRNVAYVPWFWWGIMTIIAAIPEWLFKRLKM